jgi:hypothetical protein
VPFYLPENPDYTILDSLRDSVRFVTEVSLTQYRGHTCAKSTFLDPNGEVMHWHDFGDLEGPGWAANSVGGAVELIRYARYDARPDVEQAALSLLDHTLTAGFVEWDTGFIWPYRHTVRDELCLNFKHGSEWLCPGSMARVAQQMLAAADLVNQHRADALTRAALGWLEWYHQHVQPTAAGWVPRRCTPTGAHHTAAAEGGSDPFFETSGDGIFVLMLLEDVTRRGLVDCSAELARLCHLFVSAGGFFASVNHDTYDAHESVAYALAFRALLRAGRTLGRPELAQFAYERCLAPLARFRMEEDRNGVATQGLLWMEESWDTAYLWENAEVAAAYVDAYADRRDPAHLRDAVTILRAMGRHHHGPHGFLTEGVDWNNHVGQEHHVNGAMYGDINYTEPLLNNLHLAEPTLDVLQRYPEAMEL